MEGWFYYSYFIFWNNALTPAVLLFCTDVDYLPVGDHQGDFSHEHEAQSITVSAACVWCKRAFRKTEV